VERKKHYLLWPAALLILGIFLFFRRRYSYKDASGRPLGPYSRACRITGIVLIIIAVATLANNYPFRYKKLDSYHGCLGSMPYQNLIDYVNSRGGMVFWAHPEAANIDKSGHVAIETPEHTGLLLKTTGYTGFCIFYEGFKKVGNVSGLWDMLLTEYCRGYRAMPVWAIAGLAYDRTGELTSALRDERTVILSKSATVDSALEALKHGRSYCMHGSGCPSFKLEEFSASGSSGVPVTMGQEAQVNGPVTIRIKGGFLNGQALPFTIQLIRNGSILHVFEANSAFDITYTDNTGSEYSRSYYRAQITSKDIIVVTNPIFVKR